MNLKKIFGNVILFVVGLIVLLNFYKNFSLDKLLEGLRACKLSWIGLAVIMHLVNHFLRSYRWGLLMMAKGAFGVGVIDCFLAEMTGFFTNVFVPRLGDWTRCSTLKNMTDLPIKDSLPAVIAERTIDTFVFLLASVGAFVVAFFLKDQTALSLFTKSMRQVAQSPIFSRGGLLLFLLLLSVLAGILVYFYRVFKKRFELVWSFVITILQDTKSSLLNRNATTWVVTFLVWIAYFLVEYISCFALDATSELGLFSVFCIFIVISLGVAIPMPGSVGGYHVLLYAALSVFKVAREPAVIYVTITHSIQLFNALVVGGICGVISWFRSRKFRGKR